MTNVTVIADGKENNPCRLHADSVGQRETGSCHQPRHFLLLLGTVTRYFNQSNAITVFNTPLRTGAGHNCKAHRYHLGRGAATCKQLGSSLQGCMGWFRAPANRARIMGRLENACPDL